MRNLASLERRLSELEQMEADRNSCAICATWPAIFVRFEQRPGEYHTTTGHAGTWPLEAPMCPVCHREPLTVIHVKRHEVDNAGDVRGSDVSA
ncbi:hypothetical protein BH23CHL5_BH23CHL5_22990 [soil metagenome]